MTTRPTKKANRRLKKKRVRRKGELFEKIMAIARDCGPRWKDPYRNVDHSEFLYDENGLPK